MGKRYMLSTQWGAWETIFEQCDNAPENVREVFKAFLATREK